MAKKWTKKDLEVTAEEFNGMGFEPKIVTGKSATVAQLEKDIKDIAQNHLEPDDKVSDATIKLIEAMGVDAPGKEKPAAAGKEGEKVKKPAATNKKAFKANPEVTKRNALIESMIAKGKFTAVQITEKVLEKFPGQSKGGIATVISDSKNAKYNKFAKLAKMNSETKILSF